MIRYRAECYVHPEIDRVDLTETEQQPASGCVRYFESWINAKAWLLSEYSGDIRRLERQLTQLRGSLAAVEELREPGT